MKKLLISLTLILITTCVFSQNGLPRLIAYEGDTLILIEADQIIIANIVNAELVKQFELNDSLRSDLTQHKITIIDKNAAIDALKKAGNDKDLQNATMKQLVDELRNELRRREKQLKRAKILNKIFIPVAAALVIILAAVA